ncbi:MAG: hypothetical protein GWN58_28340, partial [Anaerolineae bacterium]|nr:hypothetical protein [Anaerolineae bacterium]
MSRITKDYTGVALVTLLVAGLVLLAMLAACGGSEEPTQVPASEPESPAQLPAEDGEALLE